MEKIFSEKTVIISGGLGDIGFATAMAFARRGASVALGDIHPESVAEPFLRMLQAIGVRAHYTEVDVADASRVEAWVTQTESALGIPGLIIANAAIVNRAGIHEVTPPQWKRELDVNLNGAFFLVRHTTALLVKKNLPGRVVFVGSWAGSHVHAHMPAYSVSKAALTMLCKCFALDLASKNILVNEVAPGYVDAGLSGQLWRENPGSDEKAREKVPIRQLIKAEEVAEQIVYMCAPDNKHMTGSTLLMDGGLSLL